MTYEMLFAIGGLAVVVMLIAAMMHRFAGNNPLFGPRPKPDPRIAELIVETKRLAEKIDALADRQARPERAPGEDRDPGKPAP